MVAVLIVILLIVLLGGGSWYGYNFHGAHGLGAALGLFLLVLVILWLLGALDALGQVPLSRPGRSPP